MEMIVVVILAILGGFVSVKWGLKRVNWWVYEIQLGDKRYSLPPGDLGWPFIGNMWSFLRAFRSNNPDSFIGSFVYRFGRIGIYKAFMFGKPSVIVTMPETCKRVLSDDDSFRSAWPTSAVELIGKKSFIGISYEEHKRLRRLTAASLNGHEALSMYIPYIEENVISALDKWSKMGETLELLVHLRMLTFRIIMFIFLSSEREELMEALEKEYSILNGGVRSMAINVPGFTYYKALKARKKLVVLFQSVVNERRNERKTMSSKKQDMLEALMDVKDEKGEGLTDEEIIDVMLMYMNAGYESTAHSTMWATIFLQQHPQVLEKAKEEQESIVKQRSPTKKGLTLTEIRQMKYLYKVIDETLRLVTVSLTVFREAITNVNINGYFIPKGWKILVWFRSIHLDPEIYPNPREFNPSRWKDYTAKAGTFLPFGAGSRLCPGNELAKLEIAIFLHHFLLNYRMERVNPESRVRYLPHTRPTDNCLARIIKLQAPSPPKEV